MTTDLGQCRARIRFPERFEYDGRCCAYKATVVEGGKGFCGRHSAAGQAKARDKATTKYQEQTARQEARWAREGYNQAAGNWCRAKGMTLEDLQK